MDELTDSIMSLDDRLALEAAKNLKLGLASELRKREETVASDEVAIESLREMDVDGSAAQLRDLLVKESNQAELAQIARLTLLAAAEYPELRKYVEGAVEGAHAGVRMIDPISLLAVGVTVYMIGRLLPRISVEKKGRDLKVDIKPVEDPLKGLSELVKAIPFGA
jgi:hypothetical protein